MPVSRSTRQIRSGIHRPSCMATILPPKPTGISSLPSVCSRMYCSSISLTSGLMLSSAVPRPVPFSSNQMMVRGRSIP